MSFSFVVELVLTIHVALQVFHGRPLLDDVPVLVVHLQFGPALVCHRDLIQQIDASGERVLWVDSVLLLKALEMCGKLPKSRDCLLAGRILLELPFWQEKDPEFGVVLDVYTPMLTEFLNEYPGTFLLSFEPLKPPPRSISQSLKAF